MKLEIINFKDKTPKRGKIICFSEADADAGFHFLDNTGNVWTKVTDEWEYGCQIEDLEMYGHYTHWARIDKVFNIDFDIPKESV